MVIDNRAGRMFLQNEDFIDSLIEADILDESNADWTYIDNDGNPHVLYTAVASAKSYLKFVNLLHGLIAKLKRADDVILIYREEFEAVTIFGVRGMDR